MNGYKPTMCSVGMNFITGIVCLTFVVGLSQHPVKAAQAAPPLSVHVAPWGDDDANPGTREKPLQTLPAAQKHVRRHLRANRASDIEVVVHDGVHYLSERLRFTPTDSPAEGHTVIWRAARGAEPRISGGRSITGWRVNDDGSFSTTIAEVTREGWVFRELFVNGQRRPRARHPNTGFARVDSVGEDRRTNFTFHEADVPATLNGDLSDSDLELVFLHEWSSSRAPVRSVDQAQRRLYTLHEVGPSASFFNMDHWNPHPRYFLENHPAMLDSPGEWYLNRATGELTYLPHEEETIDNIEVVAPFAKALLHVCGEADEPVRGLTFRGLHFEYAAWHLPTIGYNGTQATFHDLRDGDPYRDWSLVPAALLFELAEQCSVEHGSVRRMGGAAIAFERQTTDNRIVGNHIEGIAGNGIMIGEGWKRNVDGERWFDAAPEQSAQRNVIEHNIIERCGELYYGAVGIWVGYAAHTTIRHNTIRHMPITGISVGWMWTPEPTPCRATLVEANHIHDVMRLLSDGGGIYTLGLQPDAVIRDNLIHDIPESFGLAQSNGMFIDNASTGLLIEGNVIFAVQQSPMRFNQPGVNVVRRNVLVLPAGGTPPFLRASPEVTIQDNEVILQDAFDPAPVKGMRERVGARRASP
jgi:hypothetical protein